MSKRIIALCLICIMTLGCAIQTCAAVPYTQEFATELVRELEVMVGDNNGNMNLSSNLTRAEFTKIAITASKYKNSVAHGSKITVFKDCNYLHWSAPYVRVAVVNDIIAGYPDGTFRPDEFVTYEEAFVVMLNLLGYTAEDFGNTWPYGQVSLGKSIGLGNNIPKGTGDILTRQDALTLVYNTLNAKIKDSDKEYISQLGVTLYEDVVMMATNSRDSSVPYGYVLTSAGTFKYDSSVFDDSEIGKKGNLAVENDGDILCFVPNEQLSDKYVIYSLLSDSIVVYDDGVFSELYLNPNTVVYNESAKTSLGAVKSDLSIGDVLYVVKNQFGAVEYLNLVKDNLVGPETVENSRSDWYSKFTSDIASLRVIRNGEKISADSIRDNDIVYYSADLNTVFAYSNTVTGVYERAIPNKEAPKSVVISGAEYEIESVKAFDKLSSNGNFAYDTSITLLIGKDGKIADAIAPVRDSYVVYSVLADSVIVYDNGVLTSLDLEEDTTVYSDSSKASFSSAKSQMSLGHIVDVYRAPDGEVEYLVLTKDSLRGPETVSGNTTYWYSSFTNDKSTLTVIRNGEKVSPDEVNGNDIVYYLSKLNTAFVYANTVSGIYEKALPNKDTPTSVVISGTEYEIESVTAFNKLASAGNISIGSSVTLLLGKDKKIADVVTSSVSTETVVGFVTATGKKSFQNANGGTYTSNYISVTLPDGTSTEYTTGTDYSNYVNSVVSIRFENGQAKVSRVREQSVLSGVADADMMSIGNYSVAKDVQIIDVSTLRIDYGASVVKTYMPRLHGMNLSASSILWFDKNGNNEVDKIILNNVTGDTSLYGLVTEAPGKNSTSLNASYTIDVNGQQYRYSRGKHNSVTTMSPVGLVVSGSNTVESIFPLVLVSGQVDSCDGMNVVIGDESYLMSDKVLVYVKQGIGSYSSVPVTELPQLLEKYTIKAYCDKKESAGGRIRILLAQ